jgi:hypothetical protein
MMQIEMSIATYASMWLKIMLRLDGMCESEILSHGLERLRTTENM